MFLLVDTHETQRFIALNLQIHEYMATENLCLHRFEICIISMKLSYPETICFPGKKVQKLMIISEQNTRMINIQGNNSHA